MALAPFVAGISNKPTLAARTPPSTTTPEIGHPTSFQMQITSFYESTTCGGNSISNNFPSGLCVDLPVPAQSWQSSSDVNTQQVSMNLYANYRCVGNGVVEHLDAGASCFNTTGMMMGNTTIRSVCIGC